MYQESSQGKVFTVRGLYDSVCPTLEMSQFPVWLGVGRVPLVA